MAALSGVFSVQQFTDSGGPLVGGRLYTYAFGTTTQKTAYTDIAGTIPQTYTSDGAGGQYIALNARGELPSSLYLAAGSYDFALKRSDGSTVWTRRADANDTISIKTVGGNSLLGSGDVSLTALGAPAASQAQTYTAFPATGTSAAFILTPVPAITAYVANQRFRVAFNVAGNGSSTVAISGLAAKTIKQYDITGAKVAAVIALGQLADIEYDGVDFVVLNPLSAALQNGVVTASKLSGAQTGTAPVYGCRAWCSFDGTLTGTNAPRAGGNVASITRNSVGDYTINFTTAMPDANYAVSLGSVGFSSTNLSTALLVKAGATSTVPALKTVSSLGVAYGSVTGSTYLDAAEINVMIFR